MNALRSYISSFLSSFIQFYFDRICNGLPGASLISETCTMTYTANVTGSWIVALQVEDFESSLSTVPLSSTAIQFMVIVFAVSNNCTTGMDTMIYL